jgi:hypothetical protein
VENYSTVKSAQRLSAISSIRLSGPIPLIDIGSQSYWGISTYELAQRPCNFVQNNLNIRVSSELSVRSVIMCERELPAVSVINGPPAPRRGKGSLIENL